MISFHHDYQDLSYRSEYVGFHHNRGHHCLMQGDGPRSWQIQQSMEGVPTCILGTIFFMQEARACWAKAEDCYEPQHDLMLLLEAQSLLSGVSPPSLGTAGVTLASSASAATQTPAAARPTPATAAIDGPSKAQVLRLYLHITCQDIRLVPC